MSQSKSRREFLKVSGSTAVATALAATAVPRVHAAENNTIKIALVGCGHRGPGATVNAMQADEQTQLYAMADFFGSHIERAQKNLSKQIPGQRSDVPQERQFVGFDAYKKAIDAIAPGGVAILATPPAFRPIHVEYAISKGCHVFMEKSFGVDATGGKRILRAAEVADQKGLKIAGGLMSRHSTPLQECIEQIRKGIIGELITVWCYRQHGPVGYLKREPGMSELAFQISNYSCFTWLNGTFFLDWLIHNLDISCWVKDAWPVSAQGQGGRQVRTEPDQLFDHAMVEYSFPDGTRLLAQGRAMAGCWGFFGNVVHGTKGTAVLGEGIKVPYIYKGYQQRTEDVLWKFDTARMYKNYAAGKGSPYQVEHELLFDAIRRDKPYNEAERCVKAAIVGIMGRMAMESGKEITWDDAMNSKVELAPGLEDYTMDSNPPVMPDAQGQYPVAKPGFSKVI